MKGITYDQLSIGQQANFEKTIAESDVYLYAGITGDVNPAHINERESKEGMFHGRIAHGMLTAGLISAVLGVQLPGPGTIYLGQTLSFKAPVRIGDTINAIVEVKEKIEAKGQVILLTRCVNQDGKVVVEGEARVIPPKNS